MTKVDAYRSLNGRVFEEQSDAREADDAFRREQGLKGVTMLMESKRFDSNTRHGVAQFIVDNFDEISSLVRNARDLT